MKIKNLLFYPVFFSALILAGCQKKNNDSAKATLSSNSNTQVLPLKGLYKDTTTFRATSNPNKPDSGKRTSGIFSVSAPKTRIEIGYRGNQTYHIQVFNNLSKSVYGCTYVIYKNGVTIPWPGFNSDNQNGFYSDRFNFDAVFTPGEYVVRINYIDAPRGVPPFNLVNFVIYEAPVIPAGKMPLLRYYNFDTHKRLYSNNWEEFASASQGVVFEKVQGYLNATAGANLVLMNRYYNSQSGDYWNNKSSAAFPNYVNQGALGYISKVSTFPLLEYFSTTNGHTDVSPPETLPAPDQLIQTLGYITKPLPPAAPKEGDFIRNDNTGAVYIFIEDKLRYIPNTDVLNGLFTFSGNILKHYSADQLASLSISVGNPIITDNGLIEDSNNGRVYLREGNFLRWIYSLETLYLYHFNETIIQRKNGLAGYTVGDNITYNYK
ncbi:hypothetical protein [Mucilaginibacter sp. FT3.2]|uniref:hypothetical protein n=1 Tax=Mucilaginibacter sp. FT3.2 TaxID=2723090 RepID=UPI0016201902|nr:hypothetical protein [Mucilaginibacter sp. FT3.2]MBB6232253.1 hypothetical protein [Mucilaginibacter sp. FT3.2]